MDRRRSCIGDSKLLRQRGASNGARGFLEEVDHRIVPLLDPRSG
jgi:hypothetical protein